MNDFDFCFQSTRPHLAPQTGAKITKIVLLLIRTHYEVLSLHLSECKIKYYSIVVRIANKPLLETKAAFVPLDPRKIKQQRRWWAESMRCILSAFFHLKHASEDVHILSCRLMQHYF